MNAPAVYLISPAAWRNVINPFEIRKASYLKQYRPLTRTLHGCVIFTNRRHTLTTCTHTPHRSSGTSTFPTLSVPFLEIVTASVESGELHQLIQTVSPQRPAWRLSGGQSSVSSRTKVLCQHQLKKYVDSFTLCRLKSPGRKNTYIFWDTDKVSSLIRCIQDALGSCEYKQPYTKHVTLFRLGCFMSK